MLRAVPIVLCLLAGGIPSPGFAQQIPSTEGTIQVEYQYQLHFQRPWLNFPGPGLSLGGSLPERGREGISSFYGVPFPAPLGAGVYVNNPLAYGHTAVQPAAFGSGPALFPGPMLPYAEPWNASQSDRPASPTRVRSSAVASSRVLRRTAVRENAAPPVTSPSAEERERGLELRARGDEMLRQQKWSQAGALYRQSLAATDELAEVHLRLGFANAGMSRFTPAVREFRRGLALDPALPRNGDRLATIFGSESEAVRESIRRRIAAWVRDDLHDPDRLFLLGLWLHYDDDPRGRAVLEAALRLTTDRDHIATFLFPPLEVSSDDARERRAIGPDLPALPASPDHLSEGARAPSQPGASTPSGLVPPAPLPSLDDDE